MGRAGRGWNPTVTEFVREFPHSNRGFGLGVAFIFSPIWIPYLEEGAFRWPRVDDVPTLGPIIAVGLFVFWWRWRADEDDSSD